MSEDSRTGYDSFEYYYKKGYFKNKNYIITGGTGGIGKVLVSKLLQLGANIYIICKNEKKISIFNNIKESTTNLKFIKKDFTSQRIEPIDMKHIMLHFNGRLDGLLICHGSYDMGTIDVTDPDDFDNANLINVRSTFNILSLCAPFLKVSKGCVVALSSLEAKIPIASGLLNTVTKSMIDSLIQNAALELASFQVRVNGVASNVVNTQMRVGINQNFGEDENNLFMDKIGAYFPLGQKVIEPDEIVDTVLFLACEDSQFITGEIINVDAGYSLNHDLCFTQD